MNLPKFLVAKVEVLVTPATVLVAISSPAYCFGPLGHMSRVTLNCSQVLVIIYVTVKYDIMSQN